MFNDVGRLKQSEERELFSRENLMYLFMKGFQGDLDIRQLLMEQDHFRDGSISRQGFRALLERLPLALTP